MIIIRRAYLIRRNIFELNVRAGPSNEESKVKPMAVSEEVPANCGGPVPAKAAPKTKPQTSGQSLFLSFISAGKLLEILAKKSQETTGEFPGPSKFHPEMRLPQALAGDIVALAGVDCESGVTFTDGKSRLTQGTQRLPRSSEAKDGVCLNMGGRPPTRFFVFLV